MNVYVFLVELRPLPGCEFDPGRIAGAVVRSYVPGKGKLEALNKLLLKLDELHLQLIEVTWARDFDKTRWEDPDNPEGAEAVSKARRSSEVIFTDFHLWLHDGDHDEGNSTVPV